VLINTTASRITSGVTPNFVIEGISYNTNSMGVFTNANGALDCPAMFFGKSRGTSVGSNTIVQNNDRLFTMRIDGSDGTNLEQAAIIEAYVDGSPAANTIPGRLTFMTTSAGSQYATLAMTIDSSQNVTIAGDLTGTGDTKFLATGDIGIGPRQGTATSGAVYIGGNTDNPFVTPVAIFSGDGKVGIGTTSPSSILHLKGTGETQLYIESAASNNSGVRFLENGTSKWTIGNDQSNDSLFFYDFTASATRLTIDSSGNLLVAKSSSNATVVGPELRANGEVITSQASTSGGAIGYGLYSTSASQWQFYATLDGQLSARVTSIASLSDIRMKENIVDLESGLNQIMALRPRRFDWKNRQDGDKTQIAGFIAQEVETVLPDLVGNYLDDNIDDAKSLRMGDMLPTLVKAMQEQQTLIETLQAEVAALKGA
jgi:hypothetical protein